MPPTLVDDIGAPLTLGREIGKGGEGSVFELGASARVAKVYHRAAEPAKAEKLTAMVRLRLPTFEPVAAWPEGLILERNTRNVWGIILPRVSGHRQIHHLYSPAHRKIDFPKADWSFLVHVARNCAAAFDTVHSAGHLIGDVNQGGVLVSDRGTVKLIDCDSFQVAAAGRVFTCDVGVPHFTAPELQGRAFRGLHRTGDHDNFGLAVLLFHLLFMGRHPFAGRFHGSGDMPIELAIQHGRFAYSAAAARAQMTPPPHALRLTHVSPHVADLFERAFRVGHVSRPRAGEWTQALDTLKQSLVSCGRFSGHKFVGPPSSDCPWCEIEKAGGPDLFISVTAAVKLNSQFNVAALFVTLEAIPAPKPPDTGVPQLSMSAAPSVRLSFRLQLWGVFTALALLGGVASFFLTPVVPQAAPISVLVFLLWLILRVSSPYATNRKLLVSAQKQAAATLRLVETEWKTKSDDAAKQFAAKRQAMVRIRVEYQDLPQVFRKEEQDLNARKKEYQLKAFLRQFFIEDADIKGVGPGRISTLRSFGIETALDATYERVEAVYGFGPARTRAVVSWRKTIEARFVFDPAKAIDPTERNALIQRQSQRRSAMESSLTTGLAEMQRMRSHSDQAWLTYRQRFVESASQSERTRVAVQALTIPTWIA